MGAFLAVYLFIFIALLPLRIIQRRQRPYRPDRCLRSRCRDISVGGTRRRDQ
jgi:hypothetical protein